MFHILKMLTVLGCPVWPGQNSYHKLPWVKKLEPLVCWYVNAVQADVQLFMWHMGPYIYVCQVGKHSPILSNSTKLTAIAIQLRTLSSCTWACGSISGWRLFMGALSYRMEQYLSLPELVGFRYVGMFSSWYALQLSRYFQWSLMNTDCLQIIQ